MGLVQRLRLSASDTPNSSAWINDDIKPLPVSRRTWGVWTFVSFWAINNLVILNFTVGSTLVGYGLSVWQAMVAVVVRFAIEFILPHRNSHSQAGKAIVVFIAIFNGWVGAEWHIGFPVISRYVWGMYGSYVILIQRILLSCVWMACQGWTGGLCVSALLSALFPPFHNLSNTMPASTYMDTKQVQGLITISSMLTSSVHRFHNIFSADCHGPVGSSRARTNHLSRCEY